MKWLLIIPILFTLATANAETSTSSPFISGNALINPESVQKIVKELIVKNLQKNYSAESKFGGFSIQTEASEHHLRIPQKALLREILTSLGIQDQLQVLIDPIQTSINFKSDSFKVMIQNVGTNIFSIRALWEVKELTAESAALKVLVPKGLFDRSFEIISSPIQIGLKPSAGSIKVKLEMTATLTNEGSKFKLNSFETNLDDEKSMLQVKLGELRVDGKPLEIEILSNGKSMLTDEPTIRSQFQNFEPELMRNVQKQLRTIIKEQFSALSEKIEKQEPFKVSLNSNELLSKYSFKDQSMNKLFKDISADFIFSYIQELPKQNIFSTQLSSKICVGSDCLKNTWGTSKISSIDTEPMLGSDAGIIIYESWVQNIINSEPFQKRIKEFYKTNLKSPGVFLGKDGIKLHFNYEKNAVVAVLNLIIDIKATADAANALSSWSAFKKFTKNQLADMWENVAGSGQYVYLPVEITIFNKGVNHDAQGRRELVLATSIPFRSNGTISNTYGYKSNVQDMNATIRKELLSSVQKEIGKSLPATIKIPLEDPIDVEGIKFNISSVLITKNKGLLVSGCVK